MERNDERNDRMLDSNDLGATSRSTAPHDAELIGNEHPRRRDDAVSAAGMADARVDVDNPADEIGEAVGGISGVLTGAALGSLGGPIGTIIGGIAGAVAGWWAGKAISEAASHVTREDETYYRAEYERSPNRLADRSYEDVRPAYQLGHLAGRNPEYQGRSFEEVEPDLQRGWTSDVSARHGDWQQVRPYARDAYERGRASFGMGAVAGAGASDDAASRSASGAGERATITAAEQRDPGSMAASSTTGSGVGSEGYPARRDESLDDSLRATGHGSVSDARDVGERLGYGSAGAASASAIGRGENAFERGAHRLADRVDDLKDRIDGNPASRPGPDATDRPSYGAGDPQAVGPRATGLGLGPQTTPTSRAAEFEMPGHRLENAGEGAWDATKHGAERLGDETENLWDRTKEGARHLADKVENEADDVKDRVDGNPASRPGPDATDRRF